MRGILFEIYMVGSRQMERQKQCVEWKSSKGTFQVSSGKLEPICPKDADLCGDAKGQFRSHLDHQCCEKN